MKTLTKISFTIVLFIAATCVLFSQTPFAKTNATLESALKSMKYDFPKETLNKKGGGYSLKPALLAKPVEKIALVSFFVEDVGMSSESEMLNMANAWRTSDDLAQEFSNQLYAKGIDALVQSFKDKGIDLLLANQFLDTKEKKGYYDMYEVEHTIIKKEKKGGASASVSSSTDYGHMTVTRTKTASVDRIKVSPEESGLKPLFLKNESAYTKGYTGDPKPMSFPAIGLYDKKQARSLGFDLANKLEVDAVLVIYIVINKMKKNKEIYAIRSISGYLFGPNPIQREDDKGAIYSRGVFYGGARAFYNKPQTIQDEKDFTTVSYDGIDNSLAAMAVRLSHYLQAGSRK
jgi:hypothetical protein